MIPGVIPIARPVPGARITFLGELSATTTTASVSYGNVTAPTSGLLVVAQVGRNTNTTRTITAFTIGGTTGTLHLASAGSSNPHAIGSRVVSSGANDIAVTFSSTSGTSSEQHVGAWLITNYTSTAPTGTDAQTLTASTIISTTLATTRGGVGVWAIRCLSTTGQVFSDAIIDSNSTTGGLRWTFASNRFLQTNSTFVQSISNSTSASRVGIGGAWR
jgi:hypothetical protein